MPDAILRRATDSDVTPIVALAMALQQESPVLRDVDFNPSVMAVWLYTHLHSDTSGVWVIADGGGVLGVMIGSLAPFFTGDDLFAYEEVVLVASEARNRGLAGDLFAALEEWAEQNGAKRVLSGHNTRIGDMTSFYSHRQYEQMGTSWYKEL